VVCFGPFELNLRAGELHRNGETIRLQEQPFQVLKMLLERPGEVVSRDEIRNTLWPNDTIVEFDQSINAAIKKLRLALGDSVDSPRFIETLARRGYRLIVPVTFPKEQPSLEQRQLFQAPVQSLPNEGLLIGKRVSHYRVLQVLGGGGMGVVYVAEDLKLGRRVALKFLPEELAHDPVAMERFKREARASSALSHPNICTIYEVEEHAGQPFIVMELLEGQTLRDLISSAGAPTITSSNHHGLSLERLIEIGIQTAQGLDAAHQKGIIHRDIKPANIFITNHGQAKILDFGLAKLQQADSTDLHAISSDIHSNPTPDLSLTRTGVAMGTAGYMSPEQVRGEKLDVRTDLFSLGLVLYEMACGQRAFSGETAPAVHDAILNEEPVSVRELNPRIPIKLQVIIHKALQKDPASRYSTAAEFSADLRRLFQQIGLRKISYWKKIAWFATAFLLVGIVLWIFARESAPTGLPQVRQQQLTINSPENPVTSGAISPDGTRFVYSDLKGLHLTKFKDGESHILPLPEVLRTQDIEWQILTWLNNREFIANVHRRSQAIDFYSSPGTSIWVFSVTGEVPRDLRDEAFGCSSSPDGSWIGFNTNKGRRGDREIWLMGSHGENAHKLEGGDEDTSLNCGVWSPDGKRFLYVQTDKLGARFLNRRIDGGTPALIFDDAEQIPDMVWLSDGRLVYSKVEYGVIGNGVCNFWEIRLDHATGRPIGTSRQLTSWSGFGMSQLSQTSDMKKIAFLKWTSHFTTYLADLDQGGKHLTNSRRFTLNETLDEPLDWTPDSKTLLLYSKRTGSGGIYRQSLDEDRSHLLVLSEFTGEPRVTPDGRWVLYIAAAESESPSGQRKLMRIPLAGGEPQMVSMVRADSQVLCARQPASMCALAEPDVNHTHLIIKTLDVLNGPSAELLSLPLDPNERSWSIALSEDGSRIAALKSASSPISIVTVQGQATTQIAVKAWSNLHSLHWAADGKGLFVGAGFGPGTLLYVDLAGNASMLWPHTSPFRSTPSPDGHHLAISDHTMDRNLWTMENF
jgi:serine/threonine protein kinase/DNA-binding winged helix-turn-helix (wHTH) protein